MVVRRGTDSVALDLGDAALAADFESDRVVDSIDIENHDYQVRTEELLVQGLVELVGAATVDELAATIGAALDCNALATPVVGNDGVTIGVCGVDYTIETEDLASVCGQLTDELGQQVLDLIGVDLGLAASGRLTFTEYNQDGDADGFANGASYAGKLTLPSAPLVLDVDAQFAGTASSLPHQDGDTRARESHGPSALPSGPWKFRSDYLGRETANDHSGERSLLPRRLLAPTMVRAH